MFPIHTILHPTDFSAYSQYAFQLACDIARERQARLVILHVMQPPIMALAGMEAVPPLPDEYDREHVEQQLHALLPADPTLRVEHELRVGDPTEEILRYAQEMPCDLIVLGTHGRTGLRRLLMGSVAEQVIRKAPCLMLTVKQPITDLTERKTEAQEVTSV